MNWHIVWVWLWFLVGALLFNVKRAYYLIRPPNPVAHNAADFVRRAWVPIVARLFIESMCYWLLFTPTIAQSALSYFGWNELSQSLLYVTNLAPLSGLLGYVVDSMIDWAVGTIVKKIPVLGDAWPQMPGPLPQQAVVQAQIVEQKVTQLQTTTTVVPEAHAQGRQDERYSQNGE